MTTLVNGIHHVTAIAGSAQGNLDFWSRVLGQRFVKKTVNFDDPGTYHLYYGDEIGRPGSIMTFFPWAGVPRGRPGSGEASLTQYAVPKGSLGFWMDRLARLNVATLARETLFGETRLVSADHDGTAFALIERDDPRAAYATAEVDAEVATRGFAGVTLRLLDAGPTAAILTGLLDYAEAGREGNVTRFVSKGTGRADVVDVVEDRQVARARQGAGSVHHVAFSVADAAAEREVRRKLVDAGLDVTPEIDRTYFRSLYFRTPGGVLFEIATDEPGFTVDEPAATLGTTLRLPARHEPLRAVLETTLPPLAA